MNSNYYCIQQLFLVAIFLVTLTSAGLVTIEADDEFYNESDDAPHRVRRGVTSLGARPWTNGTIMYKLDSNIMNVEEKKLFMKALGAIEEETCVTFRPYDSGRDKNYVEIINRNRCYSEIGMRSSGRQLLHLGPTCRSMGMMLHEVSHTVGLLHELGRPDRDQWVDVFDKNIQSGMESNFKKQEENRATSFGDPFDFQSISLYQPSDFSKNGKPTYFPKASINYTKILRPVFLKDLSFYDAKIMNTLYKCDKKCSSATTCGKDEFRDKNCRCVNAKDYARKRCRDDPDKASYCAEAVQKGWCYHHDRVVPAYCRRSCGACFQAENEGNAPAPPQVCIDSEPKVCPKLVKNGFCYFDPWTIENCQKSCHTCLNFTLVYASDFQCRDRHSPNKCHFWAKDGVCKRDQAFMHSNCALSCKVCEPDDNQSNDFKPGSPRHCHNLLTDDVCEKKARQYHCEKYPDQMRRDCPLFCGQCSQSNCYDEEGSEYLCEDLVAQNLCLTDNYNAQRCRRSCGLCGTTSKAQSKVTKTIKKNSPVTQSPTSQLFKTTLTQVTQKNKQIPTKLTTKTTTTTTTKAPPTVRTTPIRKTTTTTTTRAPTTVRTVPIRKTTTTTTARPITTKKANNSVNCVDRDRSGNCMAWARAGHCRYGYVKLNCKKSCNTC